MGILTGPSLRIRQCLPEKFPTAMTWPFPLAAAFLLFACNLTSRGTGGALVKRPHSLFYHSGMSKEALPFIYSLLYPYHLAKIQGKSESRLPVKKDMQAFDGRIRML